MDPTCGVHEIEGVTSRTFCGGATASLHIANDAYDLDNGECEDSSADGFVVNFGTIVLGQATDRPDYLGVLVPPTGGPTISLIVANQSLNVVGSAKLDPGRRSGTFAGKSGAGQTISGSYACN